jgi:hypothetical protein
MIDLPAEPAAAEATPLSITVGPIVVSVKSVLAVSLDT